MSNRISSFIRKKLLGKKQNLVSLDDCYDVMHRLLKGRRITGIIDAGASDGRISKKLLRKFPNANSFAFEPNPIFRQTLQQYAKKDPRFHPFFDAVSDFEGTADFYITKASGNSSLFAPEKRLSEISPTGASVKNVDKVNVVTIDQWAKRNGGIPIQLMKFDIQGGELKALQGGIHLLRTSVLLVYTEVLFSPVYESGAVFGEIDSFLRQNGFELYDIFKPNYDKHGRFAWANAIYINSQKIPTKREA
ncbi:MAG: FkbM family methyltransferase [Sedimentisphaerales bacterium]|jgi:FkbM family methyltransferase